MSYAPTDELGHMEGARTGSIGDYKNLLAERDSKLAAVRKTYGPGSDRWKRLESRLTNAEGHVRAIYSRLQRGTDGKRMAFGWFLLGAIILAVLEAPINKFMLDNILQGSNFNSYVISLFLTLILLLLAHFAGHQARQIRGACEETVYISNIVIVLLVVAVLVVCVGALTIGRAFYSMTAPVGLGGRDIFSEISRQVLAVGPWTAFVAALSDKSAFFLACMNTAGIAVAFLTAFVTHDSDKVYQSALDTERSADKALWRMEKRYDRYVAKIAKKFAPRLSNVAAAYGAQNAQVVAIKSSRGIPLNDDDRFDLNSLDTLLSEAKNELASKPRRSAVLDRPSPEPVNDETQTVSPFVARR